MNETKGNALAHLSTKLHNDLGKMARAQKDAQAAAYEEQLGIKEESAGQLSDKALLNSIKVPPKKSTNAKFVLDTYLNRTFNSSFRDITQSVKKRKVDSM